jgi:hypothetical protein
VRRIISLAFGIVALETSLMAGSILNVAFYPPYQVSCSSTLTGGTDSETLNLGACAGNGPVTFIGQPYVTAMASPLEVAVDGAAGLETGSFEGALAIGASAEYEGSLEAVGGTGSAFLEFEVAGLGADQFDSDFSMAGYGIYYEVSSFQQAGQFMVPVTFGDPVDYSLSVTQELYTWGLHDDMTAGIAIEGLAVVNGSGAPIPGAVVSTAFVPEPGSAGTLGIGVGFLILSGGLRKWSRERGSNS